MRRWGKRNGSGLTKLFKFGLIDAQPSLKRLSLSWQKIEAGGSRKGRMDVSYRIRELVC